MNSCCYSFSLKSLGYSVSEYIKLESICDLLFLRFSDTKLVNKEPCLRCFFTDGSQWLECNMKLVDTIMVQKVFLFNVLCALKCLFEFRFSFFAWRSWIKALGNFWAKSAKKGIQFGSEERIGKNTYLGLRQDNEDACSIRKDAVTKRNIRPM